MRAEETSSAKIREARNEKDSMDGDGLSGGDRSRIGRLRSGGDDDDATNHSPTHDNSTTHHNAASGRKAAVWGNERHGVGL
jgi:hypothetical protein